MPLQHRSSSQVLHPQPSTALALELCCYMANQRRNSAFLNQLSLKNNVTHVVLSDLFFYSELHQSQSWPCLVTGILFSPPALAPLAAPFPGSLLTDILRDPYDSCSKRSPSSWHKAQPDPGPRAGSSAGPSSAPRGAVLGESLWTGDFKQKLSLLIAPHPQLRLVTLYIPH